MPDLTFRQTPCGGVTGAAAAPGVTVYKGIPYATAGRWQYPQVVTRWKGVLHANAYGPLAIQQSTFVPEQNNGRSPFYYHEFREGLPYTYAEDCQTLNLWVPHGADHAPVIVYLHGGAFLSGSGWNKVFSQPRWTQQGAIAVILNYRLGVLGYACLPELAAESGHTGNYGLYDQLAALQWVHNNIAAFGGDPDNVTLIGQSAGARSVQALVCSPAAESLVHRAVMSSGGDCVLFNGDWKAEAKYPFWQCWRDATGAANLKELRTLPVKALYDAFDKVLQQFGFGGGMQNVGPVLDGAAFPAGQAALPIPYLCGGNSQDIHPVLAADALRWCQKQPTASYAYYFSRALPGDERGAWHSADLWYWFGTLDQCWRPFTQEDYALSAAMQQYLVRFARTGDPNGPGLPTWQPAAPGTAQVLHLDVPAPHMAPIPGPGKTPATEHF